MHTSYNMYRHAHQFKSFSYSYFVTLQVINVLILIGSALILSNVYEYINDYNKAKKDSITAICLVVLSVVGIFLQLVMAIAGCCSELKYFEEAFENCCTAIEYLVSSYHVL